jgi:hypothetical protein
MAIYWGTLSFDQGHFRKSVKLVGSGNLPSMILQRISQIVFSFLWFGSHKKKRFHLCNWQLIARPKHHGGWSLRNMFSFSRAMAVNTLWRALMQEGLWHRVLKDKYFRFVYVAR